MRWMFGLDDLDVFDVLYVLDDLDDLDVLFLMFLILQKFVLKRSVLLNYTVAMFN